MNEPHLSVVMPAYNAEAYIEENVLSAIGFLESQPYASELIVVDDGSRDDTLKILRRLAVQYPNLKIPSNGRNHGKGYTVRHGCEVARGKFVIFNDADLAYPAREVAKILRALESGSDLAIACRVFAESRYEISPAFFRYLYTRHLMGRFFNWIVRASLLPGILDTQAGLKGFTREASQTLLKRQTLNGFSFDVELLFLARKHGLKVQQVPINFRYFFEETTMRFFRDTVKMMRDLAKIRINQWRGRYQ